MSVLLEIDRLHVVYPSPDGSRIEAIRGLDLVVAAGEQLAIVGESGSGKSSLALAIAGLLPASAAVSGIIRWPSLHRRPLPGANIGFVFQDPWATLDPLMTVGDQIVEVLRAHKTISRRAAIAEARDLLDSVGLPPSFAGSYPHRLSGGQRQRVGIAAAIAAGPALLIADEPTSALDTIVQARIMDLLRDLVAKRGMALILITHDIALAASVANRIVVLRHGAIVEAGTTRSVLQDSRNDYTRLLIENCLILPKRAAGA